LSATRLKRCTVQSCGVRLLLPLIRCGLICLSDPVGDIHGAMGAVVVYWILALPAVGAFFLAYGVVEEIIRKRRTRRKIAEPAPRTSETSTVGPTRNDDAAPAVHGYDTPELFRHDALAHIRQLDAEVAEHERNIQTILTEMKKRERRD
jgi:hypothetical protein